MRDLKSNIDVVHSIAPAARTNGTVNGATADLQGYNSAVILFCAGAITDGTHTPSVQDSDDGSTWGAAAAADVQGTLTAITTANANTVQRVGYVGNKRYARPVLVTSGATTGGLSAAYVIRGNPANAPLA